MAVFSLGGGPGDVSSGISVGLHGLSVGWASGSASGELVGATSVGVDVPAKGGLVGLGVGPKSNDVGADGADAMDDIDGLGAPLACSSA